ncbi:uncharacterized protein [Macrobrachium rosenbergii]|uniref:uncharacterized protein n=1 Tax=Macrobrachium rosenbergii TaxID=79674 RepID=UPI0034D4E338
MRCTDGTNPLGVSRRRTVILIRLDFKCLQTLRRPPALSPNPPTPVSTHQRGEEGVLRPGSDDVPIKHFDFEVQLQRIKKNKGNRPFLEKGDKTPYHRRYIKVYLKCPRVWAIRRVIRKLPFGIGLALVYLLRRDCYLQNPEGCGPEGPRRLDSPPPDGWYRSSSKPQVNA